VQSKISAKSFLWKKKNLPVKKALKAFLRTASEASGEVLSEVNLFVNKLW